MGFTIFTREQVTPREIVSHGAMRDELILNEGPPPAYPAGSSVFYAPPALDIYSSDPAARRVLLNDPNGTATGADIFAAFPLIREPKAAEIRAEGSKRLRSLAGPYSEEEREGWESQKQQARAWLANPETRIPTVSAMATTRGIPVDVMVDKIMENVFLYETAYGQIVGTQQALLDQIYAATDYGAMLAINWPN